MLWFVGLSLAVVWSVFRSPALDYRMVALGSVLPLVEVVAGRPFVLHTLVGAVGALVIVMLATRRRRLARRRWLGLPIGLFLHLALDGVWSDRRLFWWPFGGWSLQGGAPESSRPLGLIILMELAGAGALVWWWRRWSLNDRSRRSEFLRTGRLGRDLD